MELLACALRDLALPFMSQYEDVYPARSQRTDGPGYAGATEHELEKLVGEIGQLIRAAAPEKRPELKDFAETLVREEIGAIGEPAETAAEQVTQRRANPLAAGILLVLLGAALAVIFAPVGLSLAAIGVLLMVWGAILSWFRK
jgi:hypothetical protein